MKKVVTIAFQALGLVFCYPIYRLVTGPIEFNKVKIECYTEVVEKPKDIRTAQDAYLRISGKYVDNFDQLTSFIENAQFTVTSQCGTSWTTFDKMLNIGVMRQRACIDILGYVKVRGPLFEDFDRYKTLRCVPKFTKNEAPFLFATKTSEIRDKNNVMSSAFEVYVSKRDALKGPDKGLIDKEAVKNSVGDVKDESMKAGSFEEITVNGGWPTFYSVKIVKQ